VLVVDDDEDICDTLRELFEDEGYAVSTACDGGVALAKLRQAPKKPDVVILDMMMPILDGAAVHALMRQDPELAGIRVVVCTADPRRAPPGVPVIQKPVSLAALLEAARGAT
jgi:CheY-like chemotaxis protein